MEILVYLTVFLLLGAVSILAVGLGENFDQAMAIAKEIKGKKKDMRKQKSSLSKQLSRLNRKRKNLVAQVQMREHTYRLMTIAGIIAGGAISTRSFSVAPRRRRMKPTSAAWLPCASVAVTRCRAGP